MGRLIVSVVNESGAQCFSAEFPTHKNAMCFIEWRIEELLAQGAKYIDMVEKDSQTETRYCANAIADGVFTAVKPDWRYALVQKAA
jgi:hypothetical protein